MTPMSPRLRDALETELASARSHPDPAVRWTSAERAHVLSQPWAWPHTRVHLTMIRLAVRDRNRRELVGQVLRLVVAGAGSATGRYPTGNTGRSDVGITEVMEIPADLRDLLGS